MHVTITATHIAAGIPGCASLCPLARALREQMGMVWIVTHRIALCCSLGGEIWYRLPPEAATWIAAADRGEAVAPVTFMLEEVACKLAH